MREYFIIAQIEKLAEHFSQKFKCLFLMICGYKLDSYKFQCEV